MLVRLPYTLAWFGVLSLFCAQVHAQQNEATRAQSHLDAARALVKQEPPYTAATQYAQLVAFEHKAGREKQAREIGYLLRGLMQEDTTTDKDRYIHLIAQTQLDQDQTEDAIRSLSHLAKPGVMTKNLHLEAAQQLTRRFGLQRGVTYAREHFPEVMSRRDVYCKFCYTLAVKGQAKTAREFIDITLDLSEIYAKLDAYRFAAFGLHTAGDSQGAVVFLDDALSQAEAYAIPSTKVGMLAELAITYHEIGLTDRGLEVLGMAEAAAAKIEPDDYLRDDSFENIAGAYALLGRYTPALHWVAQTKSKRGSSSLYKRLIEIDLLAGNTARAKQLNDERSVYFGNTFEVRVALAKIERGDSAGAIADFTKLSDGLISGDWHREAAAAFARKGQHTALAALLPKIKEAGDRFAFHLGAAEGYLDE